MRLYLQETINIRDKTGNRILIISIYVTKVPRSYLKSTIYYICTNLKNVIPTAGQLGSIYYCRKHMKRFTCVQGVQEKGQHSNKIDSQHFTLQCLEGEWVWRLIRPPLHKKV